ncbi:tetratricopeptide repeat protein [Laspinema palackyanum]|uniref:tetratricopeptide repeat protein n=1 Tax=Laspinema palackyanum TaxID=3231601 RepID=UPI00345C820D|nr:tetratricopeptide repeat protein [Laspinema sp. D2c]
MTAYRVHLKQYPQAIGCFTVCRLLARQLQNSINIANSCFVLGVVHQNLNFLDEAIQCYQEAVEIYQRENTGKEWIENSWRNLATIYLAKQEYASAIDCHKKRLELVRQGDLPGVDALGCRGMEQEILYAIGGICYDFLQQYLEAKDYYTLSLKLAQELEKETEVANSLYMLGHSDEQLNQIEEAILSYQAAGELYLKLKIADWADKSLNLVVKNARNLKNYAKATAAQQQRVELVRESGDKTKEIEILYELGCISDDAQQYSEAQGYFNQSLSLARELKQETQEANNLYMLGKTSESLTELEVALGFYQAASDLYLKLKITTWVDITLNFVGKVARNLKDYAKATAAQQQRLELVRESGDKSKEIELLYELGCISYDAQQYSEAHDYFNQAVSLARELKQETQEANSLYMLGETSESSTLSEVALGYYQAANELYLKLKITNWVDICLKKVGKVARNLKEYAQATAAQLHRLELARNLGDKSKEIEILYELGCISEAAQEYSEAHDYFTLVLNLAREGQQETWEANILYGLGETCSKWRKLTEARKYYQQAATVYGKLNNHEWQIYCLMGIGNAYSDGGQYQQTIEVTEQQLEIAREIGDRKAEASALRCLGNPYYYLGQYQQAMTFYQESLEIAREIGARSCESSALRNLGLVYSSLGQYQQAMTFSQESLEIAQEIGDRSGMATAWGVLGDIQRNRGNWDEAELLFQQSLKVRTELGDRSGIASSWANLGYIQRNRGNWDEAERLYHQSLELRTALGDHFGMASSWGLLGDIQRNRGNWDEAERLFRQSLQLRTELGDCFGMASSWGSLGDIQRNRGNWDEAERLYHQSLELRTALGDRSGMAATWGSLGDIQRNRGNWDEAERLYHQSLELRTELGDRSGMATTWGSLGCIQLLRGNWDEAERLYRQCLELSTELGDRKRMAESWPSLGYIQLLRGNWDEAERLYRQCLELSTELGDRKGIAESWRLLGDIEQNRGNWDEAERLFRQSLEVKTQLGDRSGMATSCQCVGHIQRNRGNWDEAERLFRQSLQLRNELGDRKGMATSWGVLGDIQRNRGNWEEAERLYRQSLQLRTELGDKSGMGTSYNSLAFVHEHFNQIPQAIACYRAGLAVCSPGKLPAPALDLGRRLGNTAFAHKDWETAIEGYEAAIEAVETLCSFTDSYAEKQKRREAEISVYEKLVQACIHAGDIGKALASVERSKSRNLIELLVNADRQPTGEIPPEMREELDRLRREVSAKQRILESVDHPSNPNPISDTDFGQRRGAGPNFTPTAIETIRQQYIAAKQALDALLDRIQVYDPNFTLTQRVEPLEFSEIQGLLDEKTALIEWYLTRERIYAFVVTGGEGKISVWESTPKAYTELQQLRQTYLDAYFNNKYQWKTHLDSFLQCLSDILDLPQLIARIPSDYRQLILIPYRDLHLFPLHALAINRTSPHYLCDRFPDGIKYAPSCQFLQVSQRNQKRESQNRFFAIQNPTEDLTYADLEVEAIFPAFQPTAHRLIRQEATKNALRQHPYERDFRAAEYLHFAGHGSFNFTNPMQSFLVLAGAVAGAESHSGRDTERFVSWRKGESAELEKCYTLGELFELNLPHCRLVILSACETGLIGVSPDLEEYISLGLGFLYAGATNVICSLWAVNDLSTAILMVKLYEELQIQSSVSQALNEAQQWLRQVTVGELFQWSESSPQVTEKLRQKIEKAFEIYPEEECYFNHPSYWAAFCAIGI